MLAHFCGRRKPAEVSQQVVYAAREHTALRLAFAPAEEYSVRGSHKFREL